MILVISVDSERSKNRNETKRNLSNNHKARELARKKRFEGASRAHGSRTLFAITPLIPLAKIPMLRYPVPLASYNGDPVFRRDRTERQRTEERDLTTPRDDHKRLGRLLRLSGWFVRGGLLCTWPTCRRPTVTREGIQPTRVSSSRRIGFDLEPNRK